MIVLDHPKDVVNIAGVIRVMNNFGLGKLRLVNPDEFNPYRIEGIAHRSGDLIEATTRHDSLEDAVADASSWEQPPDRALRVVSISGRGKRRPAWPNGLRTGRW